MNDPQELLQTQCAMSFSEHPGTEGRDQEMVAMSGLPPRWHSSWDSPVTCIKITQVGRIRSVMLCGERFHMSMQQHHVSST